MRKGLVRSTRPTIIPGNKRTRWQSLPFTQASPTFLSLSLQQNVTSMRHGDKTDVLQRYPFFIALASLATQSTALQANTHDTHSFPRLHSFPPRRAPLGPYLPQIKLALFPIGQKWNKPVPRTIKPRSVKSDGLAVCWASATPRSVQTSPRSGRTD